LKASLNSNQPTLVSSPVHAVVTGQCVYQIWFASFAYASFGHYSSCLH